MQSQYPPNLKHEGPYNGRLQAVVQYPILDNMHLILDCILDRSFVGLRESQAHGLYRIQTQRICCLYCLCEITVD